MTKFEDRLFGQLMAEHGHHLLVARQPVEEPAPPWRRARVRRPVLVGAGAAGVVASVSAVAAVALGGTPALAAYSVTRQGGTVSVSVYRASGVVGANAALRKIHARVVVVPVRPDCRPMSSLPRPRPGLSPSVLIESGVSRSGHRSVTVKIRGRIPAGDTLILAFSGKRSSVGASGIITGRVPRCVSFPSKLLKLLGVPGSGAHQP
jgi:hypothetical protein